MASASSAYAQTFITVLDGTTSGTTAEGVSWQILNSSGGSYVGSTSAGEGYIFSQADGIQILIDDSNINPNFSFEGIRIQAIEGGATSGIPFTFNGVTGSTNTINFVGETGASWDLSGAAPIGSIPTATGFTYSASGEILSASANSTPGLGPAGNQTLSVGEDYGFFELIDSNSLTYDNTGEINGQDGFAFAIRVETIPEPSSTALLGLGGLALLARRKRA